MIPEDEARIATEVWVQAGIRQCQSEGKAVYVINKGAEYSGTVIVKINTLKDGCHVYSQIRDMDGNLGWMPAFDSGAVEEARADEYIRRALSRDPDVWVVEIEDPAGKIPFEGNIIQ